MKSNNSDLVKLPADFMNFICDCQKLIQDVKHSQRYREELEDFEFSLTHPEFRKDILQLPLLFEIIKKWDLIAKYIWNHPKKPKKFKVSHYWHNLACKKTLLQIKQDLYSAQWAKIHKKVPFFWKINVFRKNFRMSE